VSPGPWSYVFGATGLLAFVGTAYFYLAATPYVPIWGLVLLWAAWLALLAFSIWLMRISPGWVLAVPVLSVVLLAFIAGIVEFVYAVIG
jgi:hypothetical protein